MKITAQHHYGMSLYPVHEGQEEELRQLTEKYLEEIASHFKKWNGGYLRQAEVITMYIGADGWSVNIDERRG